MKKFRVFAIAILALLTFGISVSAEVLNRPAYWEFDVAQNLPVLVIESQRMPYIAAHIRDAQAAGYPSVLRRLKNKTQSERNRDAACAELPSPRPSGMQCDEYPFASTYEGGANSSARLVPEKEQEIQGGVMSGFYRRRANNIQDGTPFIVRVN